MNVHERIKDQTDLAKTYAEDGAFRTAARVLRNLAEELDAHSAACDRPTPRKPAGAPICGQTAEGDEYVCRVAGCFLRWDRHEEKPPCPKAK